MGEAISAISGQSTKISASAVLTHFPTHPIVQLPQSLHFTHIETIRKAASIINAHPDFTLLVRDKTSYDIAIASFCCKVILCPDMAFWLGSLDNSGHLSHDLLMLLRSDREQITRIPGMAHIPPDAILTDWLDEKPDFKIRSQCRTIVELLPVLGSKAFSRYSRRELLYRNFAQARLNRGLQMLASSKYVITDRLHAHILCTLLNVPHTVLDNNYGKVSGFAEAWTKNVDIARFAHSLDTALGQFHSMR